MKKLILVTNYLNIHSLPLCESFYTVLKDGFLALETSSVDTYRKQMGWENVERTYIGKYQEHLNEVIDAETVIYGGIIDKTISKRIKDGKLTFLSMERPFKIPTTKATYIKRLAGSFLHFGRYQCCSLWLLTMSGFAYQDMQEFHNFTNRALKWGYFPRFHEYSSNELTRRNTKLELLWSGRMISWKHPEAIGTLIDYLENRSISYHFTVIGEGPELSGVKNAYMNNENVDFVGFVSNTDVLGIMRKSDVFLFSSDRQEGWGVVLNEAMNSGCAVFANENIGSVPELLKDGENGFIYSNADELVMKFDNYLMNRSQYTDIGSNAYKTIMNEWNPENAARKFLGLIDNYEATGEIQPYSDGVLSAAGDRL